MSCENTVTLSEKGIEFDKEKWLSNNKRQEKTNGKKLEKSMAFIQKHEAYLAMTQAKLNRRQLKIHYLKGRHEAKLQYYNTCKCEKI
jgi:hypothetical protein